MPKKSLNIIEQQKPAEPLVDFDEAVSQSGAENSAGHSPDTLPANADRANPNRDGETPYDIFLRGIIHDVNNNLMAIITACDQLERREDNVEPREVTRSIRTHVESVTALMRDLLDSQNREVPVRLSESELRAFLQGILPSLSLMAGQETRIELGDFTIPPVMVHPTLLHRVLLQLIRNVSELDGTHPLAFIMVRRHDEWCEISVSDNGSGLDGASPEEIFAAGFTTKAHHGTRGYGLSAVAWAVNSWGGTWGVDHIEGDSGCRFWVRLPLASG